MAADFASAVGYSAMYTPSIGVLLTAIASAFEVSEAGASVAAAGGAAGGAAEAAGGAEPAGGDSDGVAAADDANKLSSGFFAIL